MEEKEERVVKTVEELTEKEFIEYHMGNKFGLLGGELGNKIVIRILFYIFWGFMMALIQWLFNGANIENILYPGLIVAITGAVAFGGLMELFRWLKLRKIKKRYTALHIDKKED